MFPPLLPVCDRCVDFAEVVVGGLGLDLLFELQDFGVLLIDVFVVPQLGSGGDCNF